MKCVECVAKYKTFLSITYRIMIMNIVMRRCVTGKTEGNVLLLLI